MYIPYIIIYLYNLCFLRNKILLSISVTEREVINGILNVKNTRNHCLAQVRYINNINLQNLRRAGNFIDIANRQVDTEAVKLLSNLRDDRLPARIEASNYHRYHKLEPVHF